jgi:hypothetical protein
VSAVGAFNLFNSILAGVAVFIGGFAFGHWVTNSDPAFLRTLAKSERYKLRFARQRRSRFSARHPHGKERLSNVFRAPPRKQTFGTWEPGGAGKTMIMLQILRQIKHDSADDNFAPERVCRYVSRLLLGHRFGAFPSPGGTRSSASHSAPLLSLGRGRVN